MKIREILNKIQVELKAPKNQFNSFGKYKYRSCEDILEGIKPHLKKHNCTLIINDEMHVGTELETEIIIVDKAPREVQTHRTYIKAIATITDEDGESISASAFARESSNKTGMDSSQLTGATSSYARKYALNGLFCIDDTKDADTKKPIEAVPEVKQDANLEQEVLALGKEKMKTPLMFSVWRKNHDFPEKISECSDAQLSSILDLLNEGE